MPIPSKQHINQENFFVSPIGLIKIYRLKARNACALALATSPVGARHVHKSCIDSNQRCHSIPIFFPCPVSFKIDVTGETSRTFGRKKRPKIIYSIPLLIKKAGQNNNTLVRFFLHRSSTSQIDQSHQTQLLVKLRCNRIRLRSLKNHPKLK